MSKIFTLKFFVCILACIGILWVSPSQLYSQGPTGAATTAPAPAAGGRTTTSLPPPGVKEKPPEKSLGQQAVDEGFSSFKRPTLITQAIVLALLSLLPFIIMILTPFLKIVIVLSLLRSALGVQQSPPNMVINGVAFMLSLFVMYPTLLKMYDVTQEAMAHIKAPDSIVAPEASTYVIDIANYTREPGRDFLKRNSTVKHQALFYKMAYRAMPDEYRASLQPTDFIVLVPSFITSQLKDAFEIGVLIYIPFFVIDMVTSNVLLAMGMMMLSPVTISMPLKLFLLVMLDGWTLLIEGLVNTFH